MKKREITRFPVSLCNSTESMEMNDENAESPKIICPSREELSVIINNISCSKCSLTFTNEPSYRMHDARVHLKTKLVKIREDNVRYHCPIDTCVYSSKSSKYFSLMKYVKQHYLKVHAEKIYNCEQCSKGFSTEAAKKAHIKRCGIDFMCSCGRTYKSSDSLLSHSKKNLHDIAEIYKTLSGNRQWRALAPKSQFQTTVPDQNQPIVVLKNPAELAPVYLLQLNPAPKMTNSIGVQTENSKVTVRRSKCTTNQKTRETQTNGISKKRKSKKCAETQTVKSKPKIKEETVTKLSKSQNLEESNSNLASENLFPESPLLPLRHDVGLQDFWEEKKIISTQTCNEEFFEADLNPCKFTEPNANEENFNLNSSTSDSLLIESSSIETQTELKYCKLFDDSDVLSRYNNETQTTEDLDEFEQHFYSNMCTQTCDEMLPSNLKLSNTQTQTAWSRLEETQIDCKNWLNIEMNHMETQTELFSIFDEPHEML